MKKFLMSALAVACVGAFSHGIQSKSKVNHLFVVPEGYDDNDNVQLIVNGELLNSCYDLGQTKIVVNSKTSQINVKQSIYQKQLRECETVETIPSYLNFPVKFNRTISLGQLKAGNWTVYYATEQEGIEEEASFMVKKSENENTDNYIYASISNVFVPHLMFETKSAEIVLSGESPNRCLALTDDNIEIKKYGNIFVVIPKLNIVSTNRKCPYVPVPMQKIVKIGELTAGTYYLQVRSLTGSAINKTFTVKKADVDISGF